MTVVLSFLCLVDILMDQIVLSLLLDLLNILKILKILTKDTLYKYTI